jgi:hypothetical protein
MFVARIKTATVEVQSYEDLLGAWRLHHDPLLVGRYVVADRLTGPQLNRLPKALKRMLMHGKTASEYHGEQKGVDELERMFRLEDPRRGK